MSPCLRRVLPDSMAGKQLHSHDSIYSLRQTAFQKRFVHDLPGSRCKVSAKSPTHLTTITLFLISVFIQKCVNDGVYGSQVFSSIHSFTFSLTCKEDTAISNANCCFLSLLYILKDTVLPHGYHGESHLYQRREKLFFGKDWNIRYYI